MSLKSDRLLLIVASFFAGIHVVGGLYVCSQAITLWGHSESSTLWNSLLSTFHNNWFLLSLYDGTSRSFLCALLVVFFSVAIYSPLIYSQQHRLLRSTAFIFGVVPLLFNFTLRCILWKVLIMGRSIDGVTLKISFLPRDSELAVLFALLGQYVPLGLIVLFPQATKVSASRLWLLRTYTSSYWLALKWEIMPTILFRLFSIFALVFVLVFTDPVAARVIGGGNATNLTSFVLERFKQNDYGSAAAGAICICIVLILFLAIILSIAIRHSDHEQDN